ncbi:hypothetical protein CY34DRAFT_19547 [Suillus luteus UH-Slu-Lm8-n1]|uniref:Uncharacterized protein n=1 Tax=Suillus luteus UH-Slu-Lm8-n1 TaxID=930992 RepID=A0A0C9Z2Y1_9AGAM|nr:hypothetical protein CY34DRAFT_19547 [Suillus luteus UH-Slu-Lm8-n1]
MRIRTPQRPCNEIEILLSISKEDVVSDGDVARPPEDGDLETPRPFALPSSDPNAKPSLPSRPCPYPKKLISTPRARQKRLLTPCPRPRFSAREGSSFGAKKGVEEWEWE